MRYRTLHLLLLLTLFFHLAALADAQSAVTAGDHVGLPRIEAWMQDYADRHAPEIAGRSAFLMDVTTGAVLFEQEADLVIPPASLTKVVAMHLVFALAERGELDLDEEVDLPPESWAVNLPPGSSLMFLAPDQRVTVRQLLMGLAVPSGNDAAIALALHVAGSVPRFAELMAAETRALGLPSLSFEEPSGLSPENRITAREFARFVQHYVTRWPDAMLDYHSVRQFTWPPELEMIEPSGVADSSTADAAHSPADSGGDGGNATQPARHSGSITQFNRNSLLRSYPGADGVKTGFIRQSRYNLAATAARDGRRLVAIVLGAPGETHAEGERNRARDAARLLDYGFDHFATVSLQLPQPEPVRVWKGGLRSVELEARGPRNLTLPVSELENLRGELEQRHEAEAPLHTSRPLGRVTIHAREHQLLELPLHPVQDVPRGSLLRVIWDSVVRFVLQIASSVKG